jgi:hypothetical protein
MNVYFTVAASPMACVVPTPACLSLSLSRELPAHAAELELETNVGFCKRISSGVVCSVPASTGGTWDAACVVRQGFASQRGCAPSSQMLPADEWS